MITLKKCLKYILLCKCLIHRPSPLHNNHIIKKFSKRFKICLPCIPIKQQWFWDLIFEIISYPVREIIPFDNPRVSLNEDFSRVFFGTIP